MEREVAFITGAGSGIGAQVARQLAGRGARVALADRSAEGLARTAAHIERSGAKTLQLAVDVTDDRMMAEAIESTVGYFGGLTTVVACAGIDTLGDVTESSPDEWRRTLDINVGGVFITARHGIPHLILAGGGSFTAIGSDAAVLGARGCSAYVASKHAVVGLIKCMALDFGPQGVRSNVVCPSFTETPMADRIISASPPGEIAFYKASVPLGRFARPDEIADAVLHLTSKEASYVNGLVYRIDGGATAGYFAR